ncbi:glutamate receptor 2.8-like [Phalaenopsis equestris]|uniref:glutamate receptor 2.8-like n=1 Tax=Phalaenopsis equestris TaxID=78828 RepID=UPI0009E1D3E1|nr:glutamate receptor 2.8-like [Phalaenopsis equestris]
MVVVIWVFVVLFLRSSYTASLTSMLTLQRLQPKADNIGRLLQMNSRVGYQEGSFVFGMLQRFGFSKDRLQHYSTPEQYKDAMLNGSSRGGVDAVFDEIPYLKLFLSKYCANFTMVGRIYKTDGFGFVFPRGSPLVANVSRAILNVTEDDIMINIARKWFGDRATCPASGVGDTVSSSRLDFWRFGGLFLITGTLSILSLLLYIGIFIWKEWHDLRASAINSEDRGGSIWDKMRSWARYYDRFKDDSSVITQNEKRELELSCKNAVNNDDGLLQRSGALSISDVSAANFSSPERMVVSYS